MVSGLWSNKSVWSVGSSAEDCLGHGAALSGSMMVKPAAEEVVMTARLDRCKIHVPHSADSSVSVVNNFHTVQSFSVFWNPPADSEQLLNVLWCCLPGGISLVLALHVEQMYIFSEGGQLQWNNCFCSDHEKLGSYSLFNFCVVCPLIYKMLELIEWTNGILESFCSLSGIGLWL